MSPSQTCFARNIAVFLICCGIPLGNAQAQDFSDGWYRLKAAAYLDDACLEGNQAGSSQRSGAAFMDACQTVSGQLWRFVLAGDGYYRMQTQSRGEGECLEANQKDSAVHKGGAFMDKCQNVTGQLWKPDVLKVTSSSTPYYLLKAQSRGTFECLEAGYLPGGEEHLPHGGGTFMTACTTRTDQMWKFERVSDVTTKAQDGGVKSNRLPQPGTSGAGLQPSPGVYYRLSTQFRGPDMNLDVHNGGEKNNMTELAPRGDFSGQYWRFTPAGNGYYRMSTKFRGENVCLDVHNGGEKNNQVQLTDCGDYSGQFWQLREDNGWVRLTTQFRGPNMCLDIFNSGPDNNQPHLTDCANLSGQLWKLESTAQQAAPNESSKPFVPMQRGNSEDDQ
jgi:Ricin-type beta-trefoil lectin domain